MLLFANQKELQKVLSNVDVKTSKAIIKNLKPFANSQKTWVATVDYFKNENDFVHSKLNVTTLHQNHPVGFGFTYKARTGEIDVRKTFWKKLWYTKIGEKPTEISRSSISFEKIKEAMKAIGA